MDSNAGGTGNTAVGNNALTANTTGQFNVAAGADALAINTSGTGNVALGYSALSSMYTGTGNIAIGTNAGASIGAAITAGNFVIGVTYTIVTSGTTNFSAVGAANNNPGTVFVASGVGSGTGTAASTTADNIAIGSSALLVNTTGTPNIAIGNSAMGNNGIAGNNIAIGTTALSSNFSGQYNVAIGTSALFTNGSSTLAGSFVVGVTYTIKLTGTTDFTLIGAANSNVGTVFTASGAGAGTGRATPNSDNSVAVGYLALSTSRTGNNNTGVGFRSLLNVTSGSNNSAYGLNTGLTLTTGSQNTLVGATADTGAALSNTTALGYGATATADNQVKLGNASVTEVTTAGKLQILSGTAVPAGGTAGAGLRFSSTANLGVFFGSGVPTLAAAQGSLYMRTDGSTTSTRAYINTDGGTTWTAITTAT